MCAYSITQVLLFHGKFNELWNVEKSVNDFDDMSYNCSCAATPGPDLVI